MSKLATALALAGLLFAFGGRTKAQSSSAPPAELDKIGYLAGTWKVEATGYSPDGGAPTKTSLTFENEWMKGHYFLVMRSTYADGTVGTAYMGYDKDARTYTYDEYESTGYSDHSTGTIEGDTWKWVSVRHGSAASKDHFTMKVVSPAEYSFKFESSEDGKNWKTTMDGVGKKIQ